jgi:hypothetical protein
MQHYLTQNGDEYKLLLDQIKKKLIEQKNIKHKDQAIKTINYPNGQYVGEIKYEIRNGKGTMNFKSGSRYEGHWVNGNMEGKGIYYYSDGHKYIGYFRANKFNGRGTFYFNNGESYETDWLNDTPKSLKLNLKLLKLDLLRKFN